MERVKVLFSSCTIESFRKQGSVTFQGVLRLRVNTFGSFFNFSVKILTSSQFMEQLLMNHSQRRIKIFSLSKCFLDFIFEDGI